MTAHRDQELGSALMRALRQETLPAPSPAFRQQLLHRLEGERRRQRRQPWLRLAVATAAAAVVAAVVLGGLPRLLTGGKGTSLGPPTATAAQVLARCADALASIENLQADVTVSWAAPDYVARIESETIQRGTVVFTARGDVRQDTTLVKDTLWNYPAGTHHLDLYNAASHRGADLWIQPGGTLVGSSLYVNAWSPLTTLGDNGALGMMDYMSSVRALLASGTANPALTAITYEGRPAWRLEVVNGSGGETRDLRVIIDQASNFILDASWHVIDAPAPGIPHPYDLQEVSLDNIRVNQPLPASTFALPPEVSQLQPEDDQAHFTTLAGAAARVGYALILPTHLPPGFTLAAVATTHEGILSLISGATSTSSASSDETDLLFVQGLRSSVIVRMVPKRQWHAAWLGGMLQQVSGGAPGFAKTRLRHGAFAGSIARTWFNPINNPRTGVGLVVSNRHLIVCILGALSPRELVQLAESLEVYRP